MKGGRAPDLFLGGSDALGGDREGGQKGRALEHPSNTEANSGHFSIEESHPQCQILGVLPLFLRCLGRQLLRMAPGFGEWAVTVVRARAASMEWRERRAGAGVSRRPDHSTEGRKTRQQPEGEIGQRESIV